MKRYKDGAHQKEDIQDGIKLGLQPLPLSELRISQYDKNDLENINSH